MRLHFLLGVGLFVSAVASAQAWQPEDARAAEQLPVAAQQSRAHELASDLVTQSPFRFSGTAAKARANDWAVQALKDAGLSRVRRESLQVPKWERGPLKIELLSTPAKELEGVALGGSPATPAGGIQAPLIMVDSLPALLELQPQQVKGRIVFINRRMERTKDGAGYSAASPVRTRGAAEAGRRGAVALLIRSIGTNHDRVPHTGSQRFDELVPKIPAAALSSIDADLLEAQLREKPSLLMNLQLQAKDHGKVSDDNIVAEIPGSDPKLKHEVVLLIAHLDSWDITPGANDDAAGVSIVIEAARLLKALKPRRTIRVLLAANEEFGLDGAKGYAQRHAADRHQLALEADFGSGAVHLLDAGLGDADWEQFKADLGPMLAQLGVELRSNGKPGGPDTKPLYERGVPVLGPRQDGTRYFDLHHTAADTLAELDREGLKQNVAVYALLSFYAAQTRTLARLPVTAAD